MNYLEIKPAEKDIYFIAYIKESPPIKFTTVVKFLDYLGDKWVVLNYNLKGEDKNYFVRYADISYVERETMEYAK
jgi:hypothetical protein